MQVKNGTKTSSIYYQLDNYILDPNTKALTDGETLIELTPKVFTTLLVLVENRDKVLTKDELLSLIWPSQFVDQSNLSQNISVLRKSLGEIESGKKYIATFPGRGYRFVGTVEVKNHSASSLAPSSASGPHVVDEIAKTADDVRHDSVDAEPTSKRRGNSIAIVAAGVALLAASAGFVLFKSLRPAKIETASADSALVRIYARMNAALAQPAWSGNGKALAFVAMDLSGTRSTIYVQMQGDIQPHSILSDAGQYSSPAWSPDGRLLAFLHFAPDTAEIIVFDTLTHSSRVLTKLFAHRYGLNYRQLDWSPDGKFLVVDDKTRDSEPFSLYLIYLENAQRVRLTYPDSDMIGDLSPRVSPDGTTVAFIRDIYLFDQEIYITNVRGRTYQRITSRPAMVSDVGWKTDKLLAFAADYGDGFNFWQVDLAKPAQGETLASRVNSDRALQFSVSPNGQSVAFSNYNPNLDIWSFDVGEAPNRWTPVIQAHGQSIRPSISPDGKHLGFLSNVSGKFQIWISQLDGTHASAVSTGDLVPASFCWSSDGKSVVFSPQHIHGLYEVALSGGGAVKRISSIYTDPYYASDGKSLFARAHFFIFRLPLQGGNAKEVTEQGGSPIAQSADGRYLYFSQGRMSTTIARLDLQTGHQDELIHSLVPGYSDAWALSSRGIFFLGQEQNHPAVRLFNFANSAEEHIADFSGDLPQIEMFGFGASADGRRLWVVRADPVSSDIEITR